jgi:hypothetical protein
LLDLVLCSDETAVENLSVGEPFATSDHQIIRFSLVCRNIRGKASEIKLNYFKGDYDKMRESRQSRHWDSLQIDNNVDNLWLSIRNELALVTNNFIPKGTSSKKNKNKWVTREVNKCRMAKKKAWDKYVESSRDNKLYEIYKSRLRKSVRANKKAKTF